MEFRLAMHVGSITNQRLKNIFVNNVKSVSWQQFNNGLSSTAKMKKTQRAKRQKKSLNL